MGPRRVGLSDGMREGGVHLVGIVGVNHGPEGIPQKSNYGVAALASNHCAAATCAVRPTPRYSFVHLPQFSIC